MSFPAEFSSQGITTFLTEARVSTVDLLPTWITILG
jgi:hypothetical protein